MWQHFCNQMAHWHKYLKYVRHIKDLAIFFNVENTTAHFHESALDTVEFVWSYKTPAVTIVLPAHMPSLVWVHVASFLKAEVVALFQIKLPRDYPYSPPVWTFKDELNMHRDKFQLQKSKRPQFEAIVAQHNCVMATQWSPVFHFEKDALIMLTALNELF